MRQGPFEDLAVNSPIRTSHPAPFDGLRLTAALCMLGAGLMHLMIVPEHAERAPAHAWFFAVSGIVQLAWGAVGWRRTRPALLERLLGSGDRRNPLADRQRGQEPPAPGAAGTGKTLAGRENAASYGKDCL